jgi:hypothetical protein
MQEFTVVIENEDTLAIVANMAGITPQEWIQARVTELNNNNNAQVKNLRAKEVADKLVLYNKLSTKDKANVDMIFAKAQAAKEAEEKPKEEKPVVEGEVK